MISATARVARSARALKVGKLRPAIVLYDETHPLGDDIGSIQSADIARKPDMLIIMGTSLKVHGFKKLVKDFARTVHESAPPISASVGSPLKKNAKGFAGKVIFVNKTAPGSEWNDVIDYHVAGETDRWVEKVIEDWKKARPSDWEMQKTLVATGDATNGGTFHVAKEITNTLGTKAGKGAPTCVGRAARSPRLTWAPQARNGRQSASARMRRCLRTRSGTLPSHCQRRHRPLLSGRKAGVTITTSSRARRKSRARKGGLFASPCISRSAGCFLATPRTPGFGVHKGMTLTLGRIFGSPMS